jgi:citrate lyase subunit beta/citryl-CoA lyase
MTKSSLARRPRRSVLFLPASNPKLIDKARTLACDVVVLDLEDAVGPADKAAAREAALAAAAEGFGGRELVIRINGLDTPWGADDLQAVSQAKGVDAALVPKVDDGGDVARYDSRLSHGPAGLALWAMVETPRAILHLNDLAGAASSSRLSALVLGTNDLATGLKARVSPGRAVLATALFTTVAAARSHGLIAIDSVFNAFKDTAGFEAEAVQGRDYGFDGKSVIHPDQLEIANRVFAPSEAELEEALAVVAAFEAPENQGKGAIRLGGKMVERMHLADAEALLLLAERLKRG